MNEISDIVACPVCGTEVSLTDTHCPKCNAEFAPGVMDEPAYQGTASKKSERKMSASGRNTVTSSSTQVIALLLTYAFGYGTIIAANYVSSGGIINLGYEQLLLLLGGITLAAAVVSAFMIGRIGGAQSGKVTFALLAAFVLLIPPLVIVFKW